MDPEMHEAMLVKQIQRFDTVGSLKAWGKLTGEGGSLEGLDEAAKERVRWEYKAQLRALEAVELAGQP